MYVVQRMLHTLYNVRELSPLLHTLYNVHELSPLFWDL